MILKAFRNIFILNIDGQPGIEKIGTVIDK